MPAQARRGRPGGRRPPPSGPKDSLSSRRVAGLTWAELERRGRGLATGLGDAGVVAGQRVMIALPNRLEFVTGYLGVLRAQVVAVPVNPRSTAEELARMMADSGARLVLVDRPDPVRTATDVVRRALAGEIDEADAELLERRRPDRRRGRRRGAEPGELDFDALRGAEARPIPPLAGPREARRAPLHLRHLGPSRAPRCSPTVRCCQPRAGGRGRPADDPRRRRRARRPPALPRLRPQRGARQRAAAPGQAGAGRPLRAPGHPGPDRGPGLQRGPDRPGGVRPLAARREPHASGWARSD